MTERAETRSRSFSEFTVDWNAVASLGAREAAEHLEGLLQRLSEVFQARPEAATMWPRVLENQFQRPSDNETAGRVIDATLTVVGLVDAAFIMPWLTLGRGPERLERLDALTETADPLVSGVLREIVARFGDDVNRAFARYHELDDDWDDFSREIYHDAISGKHVVRSDITKYSGERVRLEGEPDSVLALITALIRSINYIEEGLELEPRRIQSFRTEVDRLLERSAPSSSGDERQSGDPSAQRDTTG